MGPGQLVDSVDDWIFIVVGLPLVLAIMALWEREPIAAVLVVGGVVFTVLSGFVVLLRRSEAQSWRNAVAAILALMVAGAGVLVISELAASMALDALLWPFRQLAAGFG